MTTLPEITSFAINHVSVLDRPHTSKYSQTRLALAINPAIKRLQVLEDIFSLQHKEWRKRYDSSDFGIGVIQNCPLCADELYHSGAFQVSWVTQCPIHRVPLTTACPKCGLPWLLGINSSKNICHQCGCNFRFADIVERTRHKKDQYLPIKTLCDALAELKAKLLCCTAYSERNLIFSSQDHNSYCVSALFFYSDESYGPLLESFGFSLKNAVLICENISLDHGDRCHHEYPIGGDKYRFFKEKTIQYCLDLTASLHAKEHRGNISNKPLFLGDHDFCSVCYASTLTIELINQCTSNNSKCHFPSDFLPGPSTRVDFASPLFRINWEHDRNHGALIYSDDLILKVFKQQVCTSFFSILRFVQHLQCDVRDFSSLTNHKDGPWLEPWFRFEYAATKDNILFAFPKPVLMRDKSYPSSITDSTVGKRHNEAVFHPG